MSWKTRKVIELEIAVTYANMLAVTYASILLGMVNPRELAGNTKEKKGMLLSGLENKFLRKVTESHKVLCDVE